MTFQTFNLIPELLKAIEEKGYENPTPIQAQAIPIILAGHDLLASSQTGTGKTAGFILPMLQNLMKKKQKGIRALILTPTRELALQVEENVRGLAKHLPLKSTAIFGGVSIKSQIRVMNQGINIIIATPGRLLDLVDQKIINLAHVEILVLDEADRMLDMGFIHDIRRILKLLPVQKRQNLLFSATFSEGIKKLASGILHAPKMIEATQFNSTESLINQVMHPVDSMRKTELLSMLIKTNNWQQVLVFIRTKHSANRLAGKLEDVGIKATAIHGNKTQSARLKALSDFKKGTVRVLVATDIAARGIDIDQLPHVVNFDLPNVPEDYVHRIGRTGRAGNSGEAISLVSIDEHQYLRNIERLLKHKIPKVVIPNFQPDPSIKAKPIFHGKQMDPKRQKNGNNPKRKKSNETIS